LALNGKKQACFTIFSDILTDFSGVKKLLPKVCHSSASGNPVCHKIIATTQTPQAAICNEIHKSALNQNDEVSLQEPGRSMQYTLYGRTREIKTLRKKAAGTLVPNNQFTLRV